ncbi:MAG: molecular chaperone TorD family protein [Alphaproteobacteria bacterium]|nr:molecular chaperone TorD family protein [Alphaproteobacteria bacterium]
MSEKPVAAPSVADISEEDHLRARLYRLLAALLARLPDRETLDRVAGLSGDNSSELGRGLAALAGAAASTDPAAADDEYHDLFIGVGRGELMPYGSYYLTGFVYEKPLARLRGDMARLGIARAGGVKEPEDHIASLCEMMAGLIEGDFGAPADLAVQREFFDAHLGPWAGQFFADLEVAKKANLYVPVGAIGRVFMEIEATAFEMAA